MYQNRKFRRLVKDGFCDRSKSKEKGFQKRCMIMFSAGFFPRTRRRATIIPIFFSAEKTAYCRRKEKKKRKNKGKSQILRIKDTDKSVAAPVDEIDRRLRAVLLQWNNEIFISWKLYLQQIFSLSAHYLPLTRKGGTVSCKKMELHYEWNINHIFNK